MKKIVKLNADSGVSIDELEKRLKEPRIQKEESKSQKVHYKIESLLGKNNK